MYDPPTLPLGSEVVVIARASIVSVRLLTALAVPYEAVTENGKLPETVGVPEILPDESRTRPAGRFPLNVHVAPEGFDASEALYGIPATPVGIVVVVIVIVVGVGVDPSLIVMLSSLVALFEPDVALTVKREVPAVVGVPEIVPELLSVSPAGRLPEAIDHVTADELAASTAEYDAPLVPDGRLVVVIVIVVGVDPSLIVMLSSLVALFEPDVALTVKREVPAVVGVPEIVPELLSVNPAGRLPEAIDHVADELAASTAEYDAFTVPEGRLVVVIVITVGVGGVVPVIVMESSLVALLSPSVALTVKREVPAVVGVPEIVPAELKLNPAGRVPEAIDHAAPVGFDTRVVLYAVPVVPAGRSVVVMARVPSA